MTRLVRALALVLLTGCGSVALAPTTIVVAAKEERARLGSEFRGVRTTPAPERVVEVRRETLVHDYWVKSTDGEWYLVDEATWRAAEVGKSLTIRR